MQTIQGLARAMFEESGDALFLLDPDTDQPLDVNPMAERVTGIPRKELCAMPMAQLFRWGPSGNPQRLRQAAAQTGVFHSQEGYYLRSWHSDLWIPVNLTITRLHVKPKTLALITARDLREQRDAHARLQRAEAELRRVLDSVSDCLWSAEINAAGEWTYRYCSPVVERIAGRPSTFFLAGTGRWEEAVHAEDRPRWKRWRAQLSAGRSGQDDYRLVWPDGSIHWVRESVRASREADSEVLRLNGVLTEISASKQAEEQLKKANAFLDSIVEHVPIMLFVKDALSLQFEVFNRAAEKLLGYRREDLLGKSDYDFFPREEADFFVAKDREVLSGKKQVDIPEEVIQTRQGPRILHTLKIPIVDEHGTPRYLLGISEDITERKALEEARRLYEEERDQHAFEVEAKNRALSQSEARYRQLTEATLDAIILANGEGNILLFNPAAERLFGYGAGEVVGRPLTCLMPEECQEQYRRGLRQYRDTGQAALIGRTSELNGRHKDGTQFPIEVALTAIEGGGAVQFLGAIRDLSERNRMRSALFQTEKLASIGRMSAGVAHEINNPLAYVANNLTVIERDVRGLLRLLDNYEAGAEPLACVAPNIARQIHETAETIDLPYIRASMDRLLARTREGINRVTRIVHSLRGYARTAPAARQEVQIADLIEASLEILQGHLRRARIEVHRQFASCPKLACVPTDIGQVLLNLLVNACQAIEARPAEPAGRLQLALRPVGAELLIEVADNGCGIAPADRPRLFDPFFTTKPVGEGTGLGLWITHAIVEAHGGRIEVESKPGEGACFRVFLPYTAPAGAS